MMYKKTKVLMAFAIFAASLLAISNRLTTNAVLATGVGTGVIHGCKNDLTGVLTIINSNESCSAGQTPLQWRQGPEQGTEFPFMCGNCVLPGITTLQGRDLTDAWIFASDLTDAQLGNATFTNANIGQTVMSGVVFAGSNLTNASLAQSMADGADFSDTILTGTDLSQADLSNATFLGATGMDAATTTGAVFFNTICPDGTNSDDNNDTCDGHTTPAQ